jgi:hypothetical protein
VLLELQESRELHLERVEVEVGVVAALSEEKELENRFFLDSRIPH